MRIKAGVGEVEVQVVVGIGDGGFEQGPWQGMQKGMSVMGCPCRRDKTRAGHRTELKPGNLQVVFLPAYLHHNDNRKKGWFGEVSRKKSSSEIQKDVYRV